MWAMQKSEERRLSLNEGAGRRKNREENNRGHPSISFPDGKEAHDMFLKTAFQVILSALNRLSYMCERSVRLIVSLAQHASPGPVLKWTSHSLRGHQLVGCNLMTINSDALYCVVKCVWKGAD